MLVSSFHSWLLGLSKLSRIAGHFARRLQNQERTAHLIAAFIEQIVEPLGVAVLIDGKHMCAMARGIRDSLHHESECDARSLSKKPGFTQ
jgi:GTP cyclohydrolase I